MSGIVPVRAQLLGVIEIQKSRVPVCVAQFRGNAYRARDKLHSAADHRTVTDRVIRRRLLIEQKRKGWNSRFDSGLKGAVRYVSAVDESGIITGAYERVCPESRVAVLEEYRDLPGVRSLPDDFVCQVRNLVSREPKRPVQRLDLDEEIVRQVNIHSRADEVALRFRTDIAENFIRDADAAHRADAFLTRSRMHECREKYESKSGRRVGSHENSV